MARTRKDAPITTRNARRALKVRKRPYCRSLGPGTAIGYQRKERGGIWQAIEYLGGKNYRHARLGVADDVLDADGIVVLDYEGAKKAVAAQIARWRAADRAAVDGPAPTVRSAVEAYVGMRDARERSQHRLRGDARNRLTLHVLTDDIADIALQELTEGRLARWLEQRPAGLSPSTIRRISNDFKACLNLAAKKHRPQLPAEMPTIIKHGLATAEGSSPQARDGAALSDRDVRAIIEAARVVDTEAGWDGDLWRLVLTLASTGARFSQVARIRVADLQIAQGRIMVPTSHKGRGNKKVSHTGVRVGDDVIDALRPAIAGRRANDPLLERWKHRQAKATERLPPRWERVSRGPWLNASELSRPWALIVNRAVLPADTIPYALRHSSIVRMLKSGLPIRLAASLHDTSSAVIERHYASVITDAMDELAGRALIPLVSEGCNAKVMFEVASA
ncbi:tyrosine-type recombinase/integrase [Phyllobacterium sp. P5_D12]